jgi:hypothetical protein
VEVPAVSDSNDEKRAPSVSGDADQATEAVSAADGGRAAVDPVAGRRGVGDPVREPTPWSEPTAVIPPVTAPLTVTSQTGQVLVPVPDCVGLAADTVGMAASAAGFEVAYTFTQVPGVAPGHVAAQRPAPGTLMPAGAVVAVVVSRRRPRNWVPVALAAAVVAAAVAVAAALLLWDDDGAAEVSEPVPVPVGAPQPGEDPGAADLARVTAERDALAAELAEVTAERDTAAGEAAQASAAAAETRTALDEVTAERDRLAAELEEANAAREPAGDGTRPVGSYVGADRSQAWVDASRYGWQVVERDVPAADDPPGTVRAQLPEPGTPMARGSVLVLDVAR